MLPTKYISSVPCGFEEKDFFFMFFPLCPKARLVWTPGTLLAGFIKGPLYIATHKIIRPCCFEEVFFYVHPRGGAIFDPRGMVGRIYKEDNYTLLHTKYESSGPCGFGEKDIFMFFP